MLHNVLPRQLPQVGRERFEAALAAVGIAPDRRPQTLSVEEWLALVGGARPARPPPAVTVRPADRAASRRACAPAKVNLASRSPAAARTATTSCARCSCAWTSPTRLDASTGGGAERRRTTWSSRATRTARSRATWCCARVAALRRAAPDAGRRCPALGVRADQAHPDGRRLGGGSTDAAAALRWRPARGRVDARRAPSWRRSRRGSGADVPFFAGRRTARRWSTGIGERVEPLPPLRIDRWACCW